MNPAKLKPYNTAADIKRKIRWQEYELQAYTNGIYIGKAIGAILDGDNHPYPEKPLEILKPKEPEHIMTEKEKNIKRREYLDYLCGLQETLGKKEQQESVS